MEGKGFQARKYNGDYCYQDIAVREEDFQPLEAGDRTPFEEHSEQLKLNIWQMVWGIWGKKGKNERGQDRAKK